MFCFNQMESTSLSVPGCKTLHPLQVGEHHRIRWGFNGNLDALTFTPSLMVNQGHPSQCHSFITDGRIQFLSDCHHSLAGHTVDLLPVKEF